MIDLLEKQKDCKAKFDTWFNSGPKSVLEDNRRRYRMKLADEEERTKRGLSALPSTKTTSIVDGFVIDAILEYHGEPDAISFTAKDSLDTKKDELAKWLTEIVKYRMDHTFPFLTYHLQSMKAGAVDGIEAGLVSWKKEAYSEKVKKFYFIDDAGQNQEIPEEVYAQGSALQPERFTEEDTKEEVIVKDTWWIDQLKPGDNVLWDFKNPLLDVNSGEWTLVILPKSVSEIKRLAKVGVFDKIKESQVAKKLAEYQKPTSSEYTDNEGVASDPDTVDMEDFNRVPVWVFFRKDGCRWMCSFSVEGKLELSSEKSVNEVFFAGRKVDRIPVVVGCNDFELWEAFGRGLPKLIAPIEDEIIDAKNNANDFAKQLVQGRWRIQPDSDIDVDSVLNGRAFLAKQGEVEQIPTPPGFMESLRVGDNLNADLHELAPAGLEARSIVPKGTSRTLGAAQMQAQVSDKKLSSRLLIRNETFFKPLLYLIAQMEFSFETDELVLRIAAKNTDTGQKDENGQAVPFQPPTTVNTQMEQAVDLEALDFEVEVQINAGLGSVPKQVKAKKLADIAVWRHQFNIPTDYKKIADQLNVLAGFNAEQFDLKQVQPPPAPPVEYRANVTVDLAMLPQPVQMELLKRMMAGGNITANISEQKKMLPPDQTVIQGQEYAEQG